MRPTIWQKNCYKEHLIIENKNGNAFDDLQKRRILREKLPLQLFPSPSYPGLHVQL